MNRLKLLGGRIPAPTMVIVLLSLAKGFMHIIPFYSQFIIIYTLHRGKLKPKEGKETAQGHSGQSPLDGHYKHLLCPRQAQGCGFVPLLPLHLPSAFLDLSRASVCPATVALGSQHRSSSRARAGCRRPLAAPWCPGVLEHTWWFSLPAYPQAPCTDPAQREHMALSIRKPTWAMPFNLTITISSCLCPFLLIFGLFVGGGR